METLKLTSHIRIHLIKLGGDFLKLKQFIIGKYTQYLVKKQASPPVIFKTSKPLSKSRVSFITTAGVHLKRDLAFDTEGDHTFRIIGKDSKNKDLTITHTHYNTQSALRDINCVFPLDILRDLEDENFIGSISNYHFGLMGYIPRTDLLLNKTIPAIIQLLKKDRVDIVLLSPG